MAAAMLICSCTKDKENSSGSIYGTITDKATGEPMRSAGVELHQDNNLLTKTVTGNEGNYEFQDLSDGQYTLKVTVHGYQDIEYSVLVASGKSARADMQLEKRDTTPCKIRFRKESSYIYCRVMAIRDKNGNYIANHEFGTDFGTSEYYDIPSGIYDLWFFNATDWQKTDCNHDFKGGRKYTAVCTSNTEYLTFYIADDGAI